MSLNSVNLPLATVFDLGKCQEGKEYQRTKNLKKVLIAITAVGAAVAIAAGALTVALPFTAVLISAAIVLGVVALTAFAISLFIRPKLTKLVYNFQEQIVDQPRPTKEFHLDDNSIINICTSFEKDICRKIHKLTINDEVYDGELMNNSDENRNIVMKWVLNEIYSLTNDRSLTEHFTQYLDQSLAPTLIAKIQDEELIKIQNTVGLMTDQIKDLVVTINDEKHEIYAMIEGNPQSPDILSNITNINVKCEIIVDLMNMVKRFTYTVTENRPLNA